MTSGRFAAILAALVAAAAVAIEAIGDGYGRFELSARSAREVESDSSPDRPFPRTVTDDRRRQLTITSPPERLVSLEMTVDEVLFDIVDESRIVAVSRNAFDARYSNVAARVARLGLPSSDDPEAVLRLQPELVLAGVHTRAELVDLLYYSGAPVYRIENSSVTLAGLGDMALRIGYLTGADEPAAAIVASFRRRLERVEEQRPPSREKPRILGYNRSMSYSYGVKTLFHDIVTLLGGVNVGAEQGLAAYDGISSEQIAVSDPEWIVTGADPGQSETLRQELLSDPAVAMTTAARSDQILILPNNVFLTMSHHVIELVEAMAEALYPEAA